MKKRIFALALALVIVLSLLPVSASAVQSGTWGSNITWTFQDGVLTISGKGEMDDAGDIWDENDEYQYIETPWADLEVTKVVVKSGVTRIGNYAFLNLYDLKSVTLPDTVTAIGGEAFAGCYDLDSIDLPASLTTIGYGAFLYCESLTGKLVLPGNVTTIDFLAFLGTGLTEVLIPASVVSIDYGAFSDCAKLEAVKVDKANPFFASDTQGALYTKDMAELAQVPGAFSGTFVIPDTVTAMHDLSFYGCHALTTVVIPASITELDINTFQECPSLTAFEVAEGNPVFHSRDGILYSKTYTYDEDFNEIPMTALFSCPAAKDLGDFTVPADVQMLQLYCFENCKYLTSITIPASCIHVGHHDFDGCTGLQDIHFEAGHIFYYSVDGVAFNQEMTVEEYDYESDEYNTEYWPKGSRIAFFPAGRTGYYEVPEGVTHIPDDVMQDAAIEAIRFPSTLESLDESALSWCEDLEWICFTGDKPEVLSDALSDVIATVYYPANNATWADPEFPDVWAELTYVPYTPGNEPVWVDTPFTDVPSGAWYEAPIAWAVAKGITNGLSATEFGPTATCNRAQVVTFLWRAAGSPAPTSTVNPFVDVQAGGFYEDAVLWAVEKGITTGSDATHFNPTGVCNRAQVVTFLYRAFGSPAVSTDGLPFTDVPAGSWYEAPIAWAVKNEVTNGLSATEFGPNTACNRAQVVTFLHRAYN